jgi:hypothetical protein
LEEAVGAMVALGFGQPVVAEEEVTERPDLLYMMLYTHLSIDFLYRLSD